MKKLTGLLMVIFVFALALLACESDESQEKCKTKLDSSKVFVDLGTIASGGDLVCGEKGATDPGATVTVTDSEGNSVDRTAGDDGHFCVPIAALNYKRGDTVTVTAKVDDCEPTSITIRIPQPGE